MNFITPYDNFSEWSRQQTLDFDRYIWRLRPLACLNLFFTRQLICLLAPLPISSSHRLSAYEDGQSKIL